RAQGLGLKTRKLGAEKTRFNTLRPFSSARLLQPCVFRPKPNVFGPGLFSSQFLGKKALLKAGFREQSTHIRAHTSHKSHPILISV
ncbi:MAG TPA: hypothetical protein PL157_16365, partial [Acidobacteriota bacterium]|nr:hypothetical protein [Acidobacteriota bacterium]